MSVILRSGFYNIHRKMSNVCGIVQQRMKEKLENALDPVHLNLINESYMHNVPQGAETHFKVLVVSNKFDNVSLVERHRMVNNILKEELETGVHALSILAKTPKQWNPQEAVESSPNCRGGFGK
ncbi:bolA-like protein DDB_G0274169 [Anticarsia gemmatalis]|uniref:bolA-like protein DDB_G0274169 n=1 Tax=Anticarsia gemmatalis TaxID=129554 RepID=UPI003F777091